MWWTFARLFLLISQCLSHAAALPEDSAAAGAAAETWAVSSGPPVSVEPPPPADRSPRGATVPPAVSAVSGVTHGDTGGGMPVSERPQLTPSADTGYTPETEPVALSVSSPSQRGTTSLGGAAPDHEAAKSGESRLSPTPAAPSAEISPRGKMPKSGVPNGLMLQRSASIDMGARLNNGHPISSTSVTPKSRPSAQRARASTQETSTTDAASYFKRSTPMSLSAETGLSAATGQLSNIRDTPTTKLPSLETRSTDTETQLSSEDGPISTKSEPVILTTPKSHPVLLPPPDRTFSSVPSSSPKTTAVFTPTVALHTQSPSESPAPSASRLSTTPDLLHPSSSPASSLSSVRHPPPSESSPLPSTSPKPSSPPSASPEPSSPPFIYPEPSSTPSTSPERSSLPSTSPEASASTNGLVTESGPTTVRPGAPDVDCALELPLDVQRWRPGSDIQINFPLTVSSETLNAISFLKESYETQLPPTVSSETVKASCAWNSTVSYDYKHVVCGQLTALTPCIVR